MNSITLSPKQLAIISRAIYEYNLKPATIKKYLSGGSLSEEIRECIRRSRKYVHTDSAHTGPKLNFEFVAGRHLAKMQSMRKLSRRHRLIYSKMSPHAKEAYLQSFTTAKRPVFNSDFNYARSRAGFKRLSDFKTPVSKVKQYLDVIYNPSVKKSPMAVDLGQWCGVEIECLMPVYESTEQDCDNCDGVGCSECDDTGIMNSRADNFAELKTEIQNAKLKYVSLHSDGSINAQSGYFGAEFTVFYKITDNTPLKRLVAFLNSKGAKVNASCGLHVHLDCRDIKDSELKVSTRARRIGNTLPVLSQLVPKSRLTNSYCKIGVSRFNGDRYFAVNKTAFKKYSTVEVRLHSGTTDFNKINSWVNLLFKASREKSLSKNTVTQVEDLCALLGMTDAETLHFISRAQLFTNTNTQEAA